jgi:hypothetical protein
VEYFGPIMLFIFFKLHAPEEEIVMDMEHAIVELVLVILDGRGRSRNNVLFLYLKTFILYSFFHFNSSASGCDTLSPTACGNATNPCNNGTCVGSNLCNIFINIFIIT